MYNLLIFKVDHVVSVLPGLLTIVSELHELHELHEPFALIDMYQCEGIECVFLLLFVVIS